MEKVESSAENVEAIHRKVEQIAGKEESAEFISQVRGKVERIDEKVESSAANVEAIHRKVEQIAGKEESAEIISLVV